MKRNTFYSLILIICILSIFLVFAVSNILLVEQVTELGMDLIITDGYIGFNVDSDKIHFGDLPPDAQSSTRPVNIYNGADTTRVVWIKNYGDVGPWVKMDYLGRRYLKDVKFELAANTTAVVTYSAKPVGDLEVGKKYEGISKIIIKRCIFCEN